MKIFFVHFIVEFLSGLKDTPNPAGNLLKRNHAGTACKANDLCPLKDLIPLHIFRTHRNDKCPAPCLYVSDQDLNAAAEIYLI